MRKVIIFFIFLSFLMLEAGFTTAGAQMIPTSQMISVRVDNKPLNIEYIVIADEVFVPADELKKVFQDTFTWDPGTLWVSIGGREAPIKGLSFQDKVFLPLRGMAMQFGYEIDWDSTKSILNIRTKKALTEQKTLTAEKQPAADGQSQAGQPPQTVEIQQNTGESQTATAEKQPATEDGIGERRRKALTISLFKEDPITNVLEQVTALRIYADVKNSRNRPLKNIVAHCIFRYPEGEVFFDDTVTIESMEPYESRRVIFYTINPVQVGKLKYEMTVKAEKPAVPRNY